MKIIKGDIISQHIDLIDSSKFRIDHGHPLKEIHNMISGIDVVDTTPFIDMMDD